MTDTATIETKGSLEYDASAALVLTRQALRARDSAADFEVDSPEMLQAAGEDLRAVMGLKKRVEEQKTAITGPLNTALRAIHDLFRPPEQHIQQAIAHIKGAMLTYTTAQERLAEEARRKAEAEARAERDRLAEEQRRQEQVAREAVQAAEAAAREVSLAQDRGDAEGAAKAQDEARQHAEVAQAANVEAEAIAVTAAVISMPVALVAPARVKGISTSTSFDFVVDDLLALVQFVAANPQHIGLVAADTVRLRAQVRATGLRTNLPGVRVFTKSTMSARAS